MCGICGQISYSKEIDKQRVEAMNRSLFHRGPDADGFYYSKPGCLPAVGLGHRRLSIIDLSPRGDQPMSNEDESIWVIFNGEIYNFRALREELKHKGHIFKSQTDTEVIIHLYEDLGVQCLNSLRGMFSFAIWDEEKNRLFIARDRVGKKPLYYAETSDGLSFASEINPLYGIKGMDNDLDYTAIDYFLTYSYIPCPLSIVKGIRKLPPAHYLLLENRKVSIQRYWELSYLPKHDYTFEEAVDVLIEKLEEAVRIRLYSDVPLGCFLSGGVDSSIIVAMMAKLSDMPVRTFTIGFRNEEYDETEFARIVSNRYNTEHIEFVVEPAAIDVLPNIITHYGEPFGDSSALPTWYLSQLTGEHVKVVLNGDGGDELFCGYNWYDTGFKLAQLNRLFPPLVSGWLFHLLDHDSRFKPVRKIRRLFELLKKTGASRFADLRSQISSSFKQSLYSDMFLEGLMHDTDAIVERFYEKVPFLDEFDRMAYVDAMTYLPEEILVKVDRATMAHSIEGRSPFLDHQFMEFSARLPSAFRYRKGEKKFILKEATKRLFPDGFFDRPKSGFSVPIDEWFRGDLASYAFENITDGVLADIGILNEGAVLDLLERNNTGRENHGTIIWRLLVLSLWSKKFLN